MDIFDDDVRWPTRALLQEEEEVAALSADACLEPPEVQWHPGASLQGNQHMVVVAASPAACALLQESFPGALEVGRITLPEISTPDGATAPSSDGGSLGRVSCQLLQPRGCPGVLLALCPKPVAPERAGAWARLLLDALAPQHVLVLAAMQARQFRGLGDPSQEPLAFMVRTGAASSSSAAAAVPLLPTGNVVGGLAAAVITQCELRGVPGALLLSVDMVLSLAPLALPLLASGGAALLRAWGAAVAAAALGDRTAVARTVSRLEQRVSALYS